MFSILIACLMILVGCQDGGDDDGNDGGSNYLAPLVGTWRTMVGSASESNVATIKISSNGTLYFKVQKPDGEFVSDYTATMSNVIASSWEIEITDYNGGDIDWIGRRYTDYYTLSEDTLELEDLTLVKQIYPSDFYFKIISPSGEEDVEPGLTYEIIWSASVETGSMTKIDLYKDGVFYETIASSASLYTGNSSYSWTVPSDYPEDSTYSIAITSVAYPLFWDKGEDFYIRRPIEEVTLYPIQDTYVSSLGVNDNYGDANAIYTGYVNFGIDRDANYTGLVQFRVSSIPSDATVVKATLHLISSRNSVLCGRGSSATVNLSRILSIWGEGGVSYSTMPSVSNSYFKSMDGIIFGDCRTYSYEFNITSTVSDWISGNSRNYGIAIKASNISNYYGSDEDYGVFYSSNYSVNAGPRLEIEYR